MVHQMEQQKMTNFSKILFKGGKIDGQMTLIDRFLYQNQNKIKGDIECGIYEFDPNNHKDHAPIDDNDRNNEMKFNKTIITDNEVILKKPNGEEISDPEEMLKYFVEIWKDHLNTKSGYDSNYLKIDGQN